MTQLCADKLPTFAVVREDKVYGRYVTLYDRTVEFTSTETGQVSDVQDCRSDPGMSHHETVAAPFVSTSNCWHVCFANKKL